MTRTREWTKLGFLVAITILLAVGFAAAVNLPATTEAQQRNAPVFTTAAPVAIPAAQPAADLGEAFVAVAEAVRPAVVFIESQTRVRNTGRGSAFDDFLRDPDNAPDPRRSGQGSGFIISANGYIMTNNHVVEDATRLEVALLDGRRFDAEVVGKDPRTDIAIIKIDAEDLTAVTIGSSEGVRVGEWVLAIGNPLGDAFSFTVTAGIVSGRGRRLAGLQRAQQQQYSIHDFIQTDAAINPGNSGGPLVNIHGQVIGVNSAIASQTGFYTGYGFAVPIDLARKVSEQLIATGHVRRAILGISITDATPEDAEYVGLDSIFGVKVEAFPDPDSPARQAGLEPGDVIIAVDGAPARYVAQLQQEIGFRTPGDDVAITVARRGGVRETYKVRLQEAPRDEPIAREVSDNSSTRRREEARFEPKLGVAVREVTPSELAEQGLDRSLAGLWIESVDPDGPARDNRLYRRESITHVNGVRVVNAQDLEAALRDIQPDEVFQVRTASLGERGQINRRTVRLRAGANR